MSLVKYAKGELQRIEHDEDGLQDRVDKCILELLEMFAEQGHSEFSAKYLISILERLMRFLPITPLTGREEEWIEFTPGEFQNRRCSRVFKKDGKAYDIEGKIFSDDGGKSWFTNHNSHVTVKFPYYPPTHPERVQLAQEEWGNENE